MDLASVDSPLNAIVVLSRILYAAGNPTVGFLFTLLHIISIDDMLEETVADADGNVIVRFELGTGGPNHLRLNGGTFNIELAGVSVSPAVLGLYIYFLLLLCFTVFDSLLSSQIS